MRGLSASPREPMAPAAPGASSPARWRWPAILALIALTVGAYLPTFSNGFVWDDDIALTRNPQVLSDSGLHDLWLTTQPPDYWPVTSTTFWVEWRLWGADPAPYHLFNLALHVAEALLLWAVLLRLEVPGAWLGAALFAVHPVNVESVAWISERKNLMAMLFYLGSVLLFLGCLRPAQGGSRAGSVRLDRWYWLSLASFLLAMLSKGSVAILPLVLVGILAWKGRVGARDLLRLAPFFAVAAVLTGVNIWFQGHHLVDAQAIRHAGPLERLLEAGAVIWFYLSKAVAPVGLSFFYPLWRIVPSDPLWWIPLLAAAAVTAALIRVGRLEAGSPKVGRVVPNAPGGLGTSRPTLSRPARALLFAWLYFCVALIPVMGFTDVYFMKFSLVADHYQHLALIGVTALAGAGWSRWRRRSPVAEWAAAAVIGLFLVLTFRRCLDYRDAETLYRATIRSNPGAWLAHDNLGVLLGDRKEIPEAMAEFEEAIRLNPRYAEAHSNLGALLVGEGRYDEGMAQYEEALRIAPSTFVVRLNLGSLLLSRGQPEQARRQLAEAVRLRPGFGPAHDLLGGALMQLGRPAEAAREFQAAQRINPGDPQAQAGLEAARQASP